MFYERQKVKIHHNQNFFLPCSAVNWCFVRMNEANHDLQIG